MKKVKLFFVLVVFGIASTSMFIDTQGENRNLDLKNLLQKASAGCEQTISIPGMDPIAVPCKQEWCGAPSYSYDGCGSGNGNTCSKEKNCP